MFARLLKFYLINSEEEQEYENLEYDSVFVWRYVVISNHNDNLFIHNNVNILKNID